MEAGWTNEDRSECGMRVRVTFERRNEGGREGGIFTALSVRSGNVGKRLGCEESGRNSIGVRFMEMPAMRR